MITALLAAAAQTLSFSCDVERPRNVIVTGETATSKVIGLPPELNQWKFNLDIRDTGDQVDVTLNWPGDPLTSGKAVGAIQEGKYDYAFVAIHPGPCLFTVSSCITLYTLSGQADGTADVLIQPSALGSSGDRSKPFQAFLTGRCIKRGAA